MTKEQIDQMVNRFLARKLPADFSPDCGITFDRSKLYNHDPAGAHWPSGTNLLTATQAREMFEYCCAINQQEQQP